MSTSTRTHALVLGGSIAGLLAARVLADHYETVTVVERDRLPLGPAHRRGIPQGHHVHGLLPRGRMVAEELFPGLTSELVDQGAIAGDVLANVRWYLNGQLLRQVPAGLDAVSASRPLIEGTIRRRTLAVPNITLLDGYDIVGLCSTEDNARVTGARVTSLYGEGSRVLKADLVIDCTGRGSRAARWLAELGYPGPVEDEVGINLSYSTRLFTADADVFGGDAVVVTARYPGQLRSSVMQLLEGGRILITLAGVMGEKPPLDLDSFTEYAESLAVKDTYEAVRTSVPLGDAVAMRIPKYVRRRYEQLTELPAGLLVAGDAVCAFNPVYGQGMSVAAATMMVLRDELAQSGEPDPFRFFQATSTLLDAPWGIAVGSDTSIPGVTAPPMPPSPLTPTYMRDLQLGAVHDGELAKAIIRVNALVDPPPALLGPEIAARVAAAAASPRG